ncbi:hypothetical protein D910_01883, partial [Dendroctonus ponderosae]
RQSLRVLTSTIVRARVIVPTSLGQLNTYLRHKINEPTMIQLLKTILLVHLVALSCVNASRILGVFPIATGSHFVLTSKLMKGLAEAGHDVTVVSPYRLKDLPKNGKYRDVMLEGFATDFEKNTQNLLAQPDISPYSMMKQTVDIMLDLANRTLHNPAVRRISDSNETFDLVIVEYFRDDSLKIFAHRFNCPLVVLCSMGPTPMINPTVGNPQPASYVAHTILAKGFSTSFTHRAKNLMYYLIDYFISTLHALPKNDEIMRSVYPDAPSIYDLYSNVSLVLLNSHSSVNLPVPLVPNMVEVGGYFIDPPKKLPKDLEDYMNSASDGVIYFSMGSIIKAKELPEERKQAFLNVFRTLKQKVIWKFEDESLEVPPNVLVKKWCPQQDILAHPNVKLFITHAGLLSTTEAVHNGVPLLAIPVFVDQPINAATAVRNGYALQLDYSDPDFSERKIAQLIHELLNNATYAQNAKARSRLYHDRPMKPMEAVNYWINYVIKHRGAPHLRVAGVNLPWYQYFMVDVIGLFVLTTGSHYNLYSKLMKGLAEAGHEVTMVSPYRFKEPPRSGKYRDLVLDGFAEQFERMSRDFYHASGVPISAFRQAKNIVDLFIMQANRTLHHPTMTKLVEANETFDAVIVEYVLDDALKVYGHIFNCPLIVLNSMGPNPMVNPTVGNPQPVSYIPHTLSAKGFSQSLLSRAMNAYYYVLDFVLCRCFQLPGHEQILKTIYPDAPSIYDLYYNVSLVLLNSHTSINAPVPLVPNMVEVGGFFIDPPKKLPQDLEDYMNNATEGVVYFSMGSIMKGTNLPEEKKQVLLKTFAKLKQKVIWKFEDDSLDTPPNVLVKKWCPQQDILAHPNMKLFITHGGLLSTTETIYNGVPILAIPIFGDQPVNADVAVKAGYALQLDYQDPEFGEEKLSYLINELLSNPKYAQNAKARSILYHDRPKPPMETAVYWIEYVIRHKGAPHLRVAGLKLPWYQYFMVDVIGSFISLIVVALLVSKWAIKKLISGFSKGKKRPGASKKKTH